jgi:hypothetical protein
MLCHLLHLALPGSCPVQVKHVSGRTCLQRRWGHVLPDGDSAMLVIPEGLFMRPGQLKLNHAAPYTEMLPRAPTMPPRPPRPLAPPPCAAAAAAAAAGGRVMSAVGVVRLRRSHSFTVPSISLLLTRLLPSCGRNSSDVTLRRAGFPSALLGLLPLPGVLPTPSAAPAPVLAGLCVWWCAAGVVMLMRATGCSCMRLRLADQVLATRMSHTRMPPSREPDAQPPRDREHNYKRHKPSSSRTPIWCCAILTRVGYQIRGMRMGAACADRAQHIARRLLAAAICTCTLLPFAPLLHTTYLMQRCHVLLCGVRPLWRCLHGRSSSSSAARQSCPTLPPAGHLRLCTAQNHPGATNTSTRCNSP